MFSKSTGKREKISYARRFDRDVLRAIQHLGLRDFDHFEITRKCYFISSRGGLVCLFITFSFSRLWRWVLGGFKSSRDYIDCLGIRNDAFAIHTAKAPATGYVMCSRDAPTCHRQEYSLVAFRWLKWKFVIVMCNDNYNTGLRRCPEKMSS